MHRMQDSNWSDVAREMLVGVAAVLWEEWMMVAALSGATLMLGLIAAFMGPPGRVVMVASATVLIAFGVGLMAVVSRAVLRRISPTLSNVADGASALALLRDVHAIHASPATFRRAEGKPALTIIE